MVVSLIHFPGSPMIPSLSKKQLALMALRPADIVRFWAKVNKDGPTPIHRPELGPCWVWNAWCDLWGYGCLSVKTPDGDKACVKGSRISVTIHRGPFPPGLQVCHHCDNPACVNPNHLFTGTNSDNVQDALKKGRHRYNPKLGRYGNTRRQFPALVTQESLQPACGD